MLMSQAVLEVEEWLNATSAYFFRITKAEYLTPKRVKDPRYSVTVEEYGPGASKYTLYVNEYGILTNEKGENLIEDRMMLDAESKATFGAFRAKWVKSYAKAG